ncbi:hypothetical protein EAG_10178 [Camponotus floridanus]|uniref:Prothoracicotropic hormone n=2 Tax=Camponotus floridanus TaxID=104421 RepID=PTTH_CAMFO|nr:RecName: Full=Prothoracicotropic hormone; Short=PTTH; Flags: Precursor [Camponotus floridanus]EFN74770.1 hypothetical protein EAG_10178 [Camponotus floridanus]
MKLLILCVMVHGLLAEGPGQVLWKEQVVAPEFLLDDREDIASNRNAFFYEDKRSFRPEGLGEQVKRIAGAEDVGLQPRLVTRSLQCTCETEYEYRNLGEGHYPRYLTTSHCKPKACQNKFNSCRLLYYKVHILSQRDLNGLSDDRYSDDSETETPLPEALRHKWQLKPMKIPVACVPATG